MGQAKEKEKERVLSPSAHLYFEEIRKEGEKSGRGLDQMRACSKLLEREFCDETRGTSTSFYLAIREGKNIIFFYVSWSSICNKPVSDIGVGYYLYSLDSL